VIREEDMSKYKNKIAKKFKIFRQSVNEWIKNKDKIFGTNQQFKRRKIFLSANGKKSMYDECEVLLFDWWKNQREASKIVINGHSK
jgi:predicted DNA-binding protein YlxM (UPF0122 family)